MPKRKTTGYDRPVEDMMDGQCWKTGKLWWLWTGARGVNLLVRVGESGGWSGTVFAKNLAEAGIFAEGFEAGWEAFSRTNG